MAPDNTPILELTREQIAEDLDRESHRRLGIDGKEMIRRYKAGQLNDCGKFADLLALASLLNEDDPLFAAA